MGLPIECFAPRSALLESVRGGVQRPGNALGFSSRVVGEKTVFTSSESGVHPGGGSFFSAAHADTSNH